MQKAGFTRIFGALFYDAVIVFTIIFIAAQWFPLIPEHLQPHGAIMLFKQAYILILCFLYFSFSWRRGGQTIGMKSWRLTLVQNNNNQNEISWRQCIIRYCVAFVSIALVGLGFIWILFNTQKLSWHDIASKTRIMVHPKR